MGFLESTSKQTRSGWEARDASIWACGSRLELAVRLVPRMLLNIITISGVFFRLQAGEGRVSFFWLPELLLTTMTFFLSVPAPTCFLFHGDIWSGYFFRRGRVGDAVISRLSQRDLWENPPFYNSCEDRRERYIVAPFENFGYCR